MACRLSAALSRVGFGDPPAQAGAQHKVKMRSPRVAPRSSEWQSESMLLTYDRKSQKEQDTYRVQLRTAGHFPLAVFQALQEARSPLKSKTPLRLLLSRVSKIFFLLNSLSKPTRRASSRNFSVVVRSPSHRNNDRVYPSG